MTPTDAAPIDGAASDAGGPGDAGAVAMCAPGDCDPRERDACRGPDGGAGACVLRDRLPVCVGSVGAGAAGDACAGETDCGPLLACFRGEATSTGGVCARVCCPGDDAPCGDPAYAYCRADGVLASGVATSWGRCADVRVCDVLAPELECAPGEGCYVETERMRAVCRRAGERGVGEPCERQTDCRAGFFCGGVPTSRCVRICRVDDPRSCPDPEGRCVPQAYSPPGSGVCVASASPAR